MDWRTIPLAVGSPPGSMPDRWIKWIARQGQLALPSDSLFVGRHLITPMIIQTILLYSSGTVWAEEAANVSRPDPSRAVQVDAEHPAHHRKVVGSNLTLG